MKIDFKNNVLIWFDEDVKLHEHKPFSTEFKEIEILKNGNILVIEDYTGYSYLNKSNLYCLNRKLEVQWFLDYPYKEFRKNNGYTIFTVNGEILFANTFNCVRVKFDNEGNILDKIFTK